MRQQRNTGLPGQSLKDSLRGELHALVLSPHPADRHCKRVVDHYSALLDRDVRWPRHQRKLIRSRHRLRTLILR